VSILGVLRCWCSLPWPGACGFALFETRWHAQFGDAGWPAKLRGGAILLIASLFAGEFHALLLGAISLRSWLAARLPYRIWVGHRTQRVLYILHKSTAARVATYAFVILSWPSFWAG